MQSLHNAMIGIGYALIVLFFAISLFKNTANFHELKRPEAAVHYLIRFVAAKTLVGYGMDIMLNIFSICNGVVSDMAAGMGGISQAMVALPGEVQAAIENVGFLASIPLWLVTILGSLFITVLSFVMILTVYGRFFRLYMYTALAPLPLASFAGESTQSVGISFMQVMTNRRKDATAATWIYFDEIHVLLKDPMSSNFLYSSWKRFRKYNAYATGISQDIQDYLDNPVAYALLSNSEFVIMLRQSKSLEALERLYGLSKPQLEFLRNASEGHGIIKMGNSMIPFSNLEPKDTAVYKLITTKPGEATAEK